MKPSILVQRRQVVDRPHITQPTQLTTKGARGIPRGFTSICGFDDPAEAVVAILTL